jgi:hypothetical protein
MEDTMSDTLPDWLEKMNETFAVVVKGGRVLIAHWAVNPLVPEMLTIEYMPESDFLRLHSNQQVPGINTHESLGQSWLRHADRRQYSGVLFAPSTELPIDYMNLWTGFGMEPKQGDITPFLDFVHDVIAAGDEKLFEYIIAWLADAIQNPGIKPGTALVLRGGQGVGKSFFGDCIRSLYGCHGMELTDPSHLTGNFNAHLLDKAFVFVDEGAFAGSGALNKLKNIVTSSRMTFEPKGVDSFEAPNCIRVVIAGNNEKLISAASDERRYAIIDVSDRYQEDQEYFGHLAQWRDGGGLAALLQYLMNHDHTSVNLRTAPKNAALLDTKLQSLDSIDAWWLDRLMAGELLTGHQWSNFVAKSVLHDSYVNETGFDKGRAMETKFGMRLNKLVPGLETLRQSNGKNREWGYQFPSLDDCRTSFDKYLGQKMVWPEAEGDDGSSVSGTGQPV